MILRELAIRIINNRDEFKYEDMVEAYQFINDNGCDDTLTQEQIVILHHLIESNQVHTVEDYFKFI